MAADDGYPPVVAANHDRLLRRLRRLAEIGARPGGGINRQAFTAGDIAARRLMLEWADEVGLVSYTDRVGNLFLRLSSPSIDDRPVVLSGSHLDTQPAGGWLDGAYGVVAAVEALNAIKDRGLGLARPIEAVAWVNEEGCRFHPGLMGSTAFIGQLDLASILAQQDTDGVPLEAALAAYKAATPDVVERSILQSIAGVVEAHIEQGPILEAKQALIGVVEGVQGLYWLQITVTGEAGHAGTAPVSQRRDAVMAAVRMITLIADALNDPEDVTRYTVGRILVSPNSPNTIADHVTFTIDLRHPDEAVLERSLTAIKDICRDHAAPCDCSIAVTEQLRPVVFDAGIAAVVAASAKAHGHEPHRMISGASHDTAVLSGHYPAAMVFVPCLHGVSHHPDEDATDASLAAGADVLATSIARLAT